MNGIYIHVPFCTGKCPYCGFYSGIAPEPGLVEAFTQALLKETSVRIPEGTAVGTVYAGGGTPCLLPVSHWLEIMDALRGRCAIAPGAEVTVEVNPGSSSSNALGGLLGSGFNRVSIGVQSFDPSVLAALGRRHSAGEAAGAVEAAREAGFGNISIDLIYGLPGQSPETWRRDLERAIEMRPPHISCYSLGFEEGTRLTKAAEQGLVCKPSDDLLADLYSMAHSVLADAGYEHYEVSNYALGGGNRSRHNEGYWNGTPYMGLGPSAHGYDGAGRRSWNVADLETYLSLVSKGESPEAGHERLTPAQLLLERLMLGLRTSDGVGLDALTPDAERLVSRWEAEGLCCREGGRLKPTPRGMLMADGMARDLDLALEGGTGRTGSPEP